MNCERCGAYDLEPGEACDCMLDEEDDDLQIGGVLLREIPPLSREEFYEMLDEGDYSTQLLDPDDFENVLVATVLSLDKKYQDLLKRYQALLAEENPL